MLAPPIPCARAQIIAFAVRTGSHPGALRPDVPASFMAIERNGRTVAWRDHLSLDQLAGIGDVTPDGVLTDLRITINDSEPAEVDGDIFIFAAGNPQPEQPLPIQIQVYRAGQRIATVDTEVPAHLRLQLVRFVVAVDDTVAAA